jgi:diguanylate cyclase (GGDEF)-like protein
VNDTYGHLTGDDVLRGIAAQCVALLPAEAVVGRIGGEEFAVILPGVNADTAAAALEVVRRHIAETPVPTRQGALMVTMSIGVTSHTAHDALILDHLLEHADQALYQAKRGGRNRCVVTTDSGAQPAKMVSRSRRSMLRFRDADRKRHRNGTGGRGK